MDGAGVRLTRIIGSAELEHLDPFLLFDVFESDQPDDYIRGFPPHPHRGFETVTYMLAGTMEHRDSAGNHGVIETGGVQWMTAGRGIIHSEMPRQAGGLLRGIQLWVNLPARLKLQAAGYREFAAAAIPSARQGGAELRVIAGQAGGVTGPVQGVVTAPLFADLSVAADAELELPLPPGHGAILYLAEHSMDIIGPNDDPQRVGARRLAVLGDGDGVRLRARGSGARALLIAAAPIREPVARSGPFVMNTPAEIAEAFRDYTQGRLVAGPFDA
jgi:redox-sensitive bicupin YhaK (pirin superfamily)